MKKTRLAAIFLLLSSAFYAAGCGGSGSGGGIEGINWILEVRSLGSGGGGANPSVSPDALFEDGNVSGFSGVNTYSGRYELSGNNLTIGEIASTMMAGPRELMDLEQQYLAALGKTRSYTADAGRLTLLDSGGRELLRYSEGKAVSLTGTTWNAVSYYDGRSAIVGVADGTPPTAVFSTSGTVSGSGGVDEFTGEYRTDGREISITGVRAATGTTGADPAAARQQADYFAALQAAATWKLAGGMLHLMRDGGGYAVIFSSVE